MIDQVSVPADTANYIGLAAEIVSAFVSNNSVPVTELPALIGNVHAALRNVGNPAPKQEEAKPTPPVPIRRSVTPDYLISLEDGKQYRSLKRHLTRHGLTPEQYREKWGLPRDYPIVAPNYSAQRSALAKSMGLGERRKNAAKTAATSETITADAPKKRRRKKAK
jgi:predicted transcriptional regulator